MIPALAREFVPADRTNRRTLIGLLLGRFLQKRALQTLRLSQDLLFQIAHRLVTGLDAAPQASRQTCHPSGYRGGKRLETAVGVRNRFQAAVAHASLYHSACQITPSKVEMRPFAPRKGFKIELID